MERVSHKADILVFRGKRFAVLKRVIDVDGNEVVRDVVSFGTAVAVLPIIDDNKVVLVRQYRAPVNSWILEVPAGKVEPGESPEECAKRELEEETGYRAMSMEKLVSIYTSPGYSDEVLHIYLA
ncbi:MAG TPA: NUDIX domain-containing protein, partial [Ignisphaera aggregans]|nr:NUDIX domain-containing protein [Ignisphaera aggregans]